MKQISFVNQTCPNCGEQKADCLVTKMENASVVVFICSSCNAQGTNSFMDLINRSPSELLSTFKITPSYDGDEITE